MSAANISSASMGASSNFNHLAAAPTIKALKLDPVKGSAGGLELEENLNKVLSYIQMNVQIYGKIEIVASKEDLR